MPELIHPANEAVRRALVEDILASDRFVRSKRLSDFLRCVTQAELNGQAEQVTEQFIGQSVYGKPPGYNSAEENIVRVDARRLRSALRAYFTEEGASQEWILEIPKGHYAPSYRQRQPRAATTAVLEPKSETTTPPPSEPRRVRGRGWPWIPLAAAAALTLFASGYFLGHGAGHAQAPTELAQFWGTLADVPGGVLVVYSNSPNPVTPYGRILDISEADPLPDDSHTGVGEVQAVHRLGNIFHQLDVAFDLKRAVLVHWDEVIDANVVYLGGPASNPHVAELGEEANFTFDPVPLERGAQYVIRNRSPRDGEPEIFASTSPLTRDFGLIRLTPGFRSDRWILLLAGITTFGTAAAAEVVADPIGLAQIRSLLGQQPDAAIEPFECLVEVGIKNNVPFENRILLCRPLAR
ncbi:MAG: hypothetical protein R2748_06895 [Bryobacterales bacterium]